MQKSNSKVHPFQQVGEKAGPGRRKASFADTQEDKVSLPPCIFNVCLLTP